jgi:hypothetical protein
MLRSNSSVSPTIVKVFRREPADQLRLRIRGGVPGDEILQRHPGGAELAHRRMVDIRQPAQELVVRHRLLERIAEERDEIGRGKQPGEFLRHEVAVDASNFPAARRAARASAPRSRRGARRFPAIGTRPSPRRRA